jgi:hypothetical protein
MVMITYVSTILKPIITRERKRILITRYRLLLLLADLEAKDTGLSVRGVKMAYITGRESELFIRMVITLLVVIAMISLMIRERLIVDIKCFIYLMFSH